MAADPSVATFLRRALAALAVLTAPMPAAAGEAAATLDKPSAAVRRAGAQIGRAHV